ncbi:MAG: hypothetical protein ABSH08_07795 [Tepidisphaeraceae bacterium]|jgi:hypothetical protein
MAHYDSRHDAKTHSAGCARNPENFTAKTRRTRSGAKLKSNLVFFFAQLRVLGVFAVTHLRITDGAAKRRDLGKSSRGEKNLQDINEGREGARRKNNASRNFASSLLRGDIF